MPKVPIKRGSSVPTLATFNLPPLCENPENGRKYRRRYSLPPTLNCPDKKPAPICRICPHRVLEAHFMSSSWEDTESSNTSDGIRTLMSSESALPGTHCNQSSLDVSKAGTKTPKIKVSSQDVLSHRAFTEQVQCEKSNTPGEKMSPSLPQISPQEELREQPHSMTAAGPKNNMTSQDRPPPFSSKEAQGEGPTEQEKNLSPSSPETPQESATNCTQSPL